MDDSTVQAANELTIDWVRHAAENENFVLSGAGVWALLAGLTAGASGPALDELEAAVGVERDQASTALNSLLQLLRSEDGLSAAFAVWVSASVPIRSEYVEQFPLLTVDALPNSASEFNAWVERETNGALDTFPGTFTSEIIMAAATALVAQGKWVEPFTGTVWPLADGGQIGWLTRTTTDLSAAATLSSGETTIGRVVCSTDVGFDVHLLTADEAISPKDVLHGGLSAVVESERVDVRDGDSLKAGHGAGGLTVKSRQGRESTVSVSLPSFDVSSDWELSEMYDRFGLTTAADRSRGHFERISSTPLAIDSLAQTAAAGFSEDGFRAAAVTVAAMALGSVPKAVKAGLVTSITVDLSNPFGFLVVHRATGLVLFAGWVAEPNGETIEPAPSRMSNVPVYR